MIRSSCPSPRQRSGAVWHWLLVGAGCAIAATGLVVVVAVILLVRPTGVTPVAATAAKGNIAPTSSSPEAERGTTLDVRATGETLVVTGQPRFMVDSEGHTAHVRRVTFTRDGRYVVSVSHDKTARIWDIATNETVRVIRLWIGEGLQGAFMDAAASPDGKTLALSGYHLTDGKQHNGSVIFLMDLASGKVLKVLKGHGNTVGALAFSADGKRLASGSGDQTVILWNVATGMKEKLLTGASAQVRYLSFSPDGERIFACAEDRTAYIWSISKGTIDVHFTGQAAITCGTWSPDGKSLAVGQAGGKIIHCEPTGKTIKSHHGFGCELITSLSFTPDGREVLYTGLARKPGLDALNDTGILDLSKGSVRVGQRHLGVALHGALSPDGKLAVTCGGTVNEVLVWRVSDSRLISRCFGKGRSTGNTGWTADGRAIACGGLEPVGPSRLDRVHRTFNLTTFQFGPPPAGGVVRGPMQRGNRLLVITPQGLLHLVDSASNVVLSTYRAPEHAKNVIRCAWLPDGRVVVSHIYHMFLWDPEGNRIVREFTGAVGGVEAIAPSPSSRYFLTGCMDQTIRIWDPEKSQPLLSFFFTEQDWVAWTEEGIYAASPGGEQLIGWHINSGPDEPASFYPAAQFRRSLYHPDVIRQILSTDSVEAAFARAGKKYVPGLNVLSVLPPVVRVTSPSGLGNVQVGQRRFEVKAAARSVGQHPVTKLQLLVDGRPYGGSAGAKLIAKPPLGEVQLSWQIDVPPGVHLLSVLAENAVSRSVAPAVEVTVAGKSAGLPNLYVLAVGIDDYPGDLKLRYAAGDADAIGRVLQAQQGKVFGKVEVKLIKDRQATRQGIEQGLTWLAGKMTSGDVGVVSFSGHGDRDERGNFFLIPVDVNARDVAGSCVSGELVKQRLAAMPGRLVALLDACHSGAAGAAQRRVGLTDDLVRDLISEEYGVVVLSSSRGDEYSLESDQARHGYFTLGLLEALENKPKLKMLPEHQVSAEDGYVYLNEIDYYTLWRVREMSGNAQTPVMAKPRTIRSFRLAKP
jgi:WD40 repeat protein